MNDGFDVDRLLRDGGTLYLIEVENRADPGTWRPVTRELDRDTAKAELIRCRAADTLGRSYRPKKIEITSTVLEW